MKAPVEYLKDFRKVYCTADMCEDCVFLNADETCSLKKFIIKYGKFIPEAQCEPAGEVEDHSREEKLLQILADIRNEMHAANKKLDGIRSVIARR